MATMALSVFRVRIALLLAPRSCTFLRDITLRSWDPFPVKNPAMGFRVSGLGVAGFGLVQSLIFGHSPFACFACMVAMGTPSDLHYPLRIPILNSTISIMNTY